MFLEIIHRTGRNLNTALHSNTQFKTWISIEKQEVTWLIYSLTYTLTDTIYHVLQINVLSSLEACNAITYPTVSLLLRLLELNICCSISFKYD